MAARTKMKAKSPLYGAALAVPAGRDGHYTPEQHKAQAAWHAQQASQVQGKSNQSHHSGMAAAHLAKAGLPSGGTALKAGDYYGVNANPAPRGGAEDAKAKGMPAGQVQQGERGGKYILTKSGKKFYITASGGRARVSNVN